VLPARVERRKFRLFKSHRLDKQATEASRHREEIRTQISQMTLIKKDASINVVSDRVRESI